MTAIRPLGLVLLALAITACEPVEPEEKGPPLEIVEAARKLDTTRVMMRYKSGGEIAPEDETRAVMRAMEVACVEGESAIPDTRVRTNGLLQVNIFCVGVLETGEVIDGSRLKS